MEATRIVPEFEGMDIEHGSGHGVKVDEPAMSLQGRSARGTHQ
ncbi:MAG: hypothetical protein WD054_06045 [Gemmatimonadota bacterium]